jgi:hypothetical protein
VQERTQVKLWETDGLTVRASLLEDGRLSITGQDLNAGRVFGPGNSEYEYGLTVATADVDAVVVALGGRPGDDVLALLELHGQQIVTVGEQTWLRGLGIEPAFWSRFGD